MAHPLKKLKIAQVVSLAVPVPPTSKNGLEFVVSWITEELVRRGHEVTLFAPEKSKTKGKLVSLIPDKVLSSGQSDLHGLIMEYWNTSYMAARAEEFDVIHCHTQGAPLFTPFIDKPIIQTLHHPFSKASLKSILQDSGVKNKSHFIFDAYSKINYVAVSNDQEKRFEKNDATFIKHICIHNGIPVKKFEFNENPKNYLLFLGYINKQKGAHIAVKIAHTLGMELILAGDTFGEEEFFNEYIRPYLSKKIRYVGPVNFRQKVELYKNAIAKLAPLTWDEPFGLTLVESQACGTPVIAFDRGAASEIIKHGKTGFVVKNEKQMIEAIKNIGAIDRKECRTWVEEHFSVEKMVDQYEALYQSLVEKKI